MNFIIRQAKTSDAPDISRLVTGLAHYFVADSLSQQAGPFMASLTASAYAERIKSPKFTHYIAESSDQMCSVIALRESSHIYHLFVKEDAQRLGVARSLWEYSKGLSSSSRFTVNSSLFAVKVYERLGFLSKGPPQMVNGLTFVPMEYAHDI